MGKKGLGSGINALFKDDEVDVQVKKKLRISEIEPNRGQPRKQFSEEAMNSLVDSIREHGILQPILVRPILGGGYKIVAGERRWRAARTLGFDEIPVIIKEMSELDAAKIALVENLQRENLNPIEEAEGYRDLVETFEMTHEEVAKTVGRSRAAISNAIRILALPEQVLKMLENAELTVGHAKALLGFSDIELLISIAEKAANGGMTVRQVERVLSLEETLKQEKQDDDEAQNKRIDSYFKEMEISLNNTLGRKVKVDYGKDKGALILEFYDKDDLKGLVDKLTEI